MRKSIVTDYRTPPNGPADIQTYMTLLALHDLREAIIADDGTVWGVDRERQEKYPIDLAEVDTLTALGWVDDSKGHDTLSVTDKGRWWLGKFLKVNGGEL